MTRNNQFSDESSVAAAARVSAAADVSAHVSDESLCNQVRAGSADAFGELWRRHHVHLQRVIVSFTSFQAEDISQLAFTKVFNS